MTRIATLSRRRRIARRRIQVLQFDGVVTSVRIPDVAAIQDLHGGAMCVEAWVRPDTYGGSNGGRIFDKTGSVAEGWSFFIDSTNGLWFRSEAAADGTAGSGLDEIVADGKPHHVCVQLDHPGLPYLWIAGIPVATYIGQGASVAPAVSDVGNDLYYGNRSAGGRAFDGLLGPWARISNILRYTNGVAFIPNAPNDPPEIDADTVWQTNSVDGAGTTLTDESATGSDGVITFGNGAWRRVRV